MVAGMAAVFLAILASCILIGWFGVSREAEQAAEMGALAGVSAAVGGGDACEGAATAVRRNGAELESCRVSGEGLRVVVEVAVTATLIGNLPGAPRTVTRRATAGSFG